MEGMEEGGGES